MNGRSADSLALSENPTMWPLLLTALATLRHPPSVPRSATVYAGESALIRTDANVEPINAIPAASDPVSAIVRTDDSLPMPPPSEIRRTGALNQLWVQCRNRGIGP